MFELKPDPTTGAFAFKTDVMAGRIEPAGAYHGVSSLVDTRTGRQLIHPDYSALNLFRLFAAIDTGRSEPLACDLLVAEDGTRRSPHGRTRGSMRR